MASIYSLEPITHGKVILKTSFGEVEIELWPREAPRAVRNFLQHLVDGYYTGTIFHRIVPEFIIQGGDPTGTGYGGESIYDGGKPFPAEFNQRLRFSHRGIVAMAGADKDDNRSQFFITLAACPELDKNHTIFGKVTGNTIFNVLEASKLELSKDDPERPVHPPQILGADIVVNPFEDMAPNPAAVAAIAARNNAAAAAAAARTKAAAKTRPGRAGIARRNNALLSFADNDGNEDEDDPLKPGAQKKFKMTAPPNFVKRKQKERGDVEIKRIEKIEKIERIERVERVEEPKVASAQVRYDNEDEVKPKKEVKDKVFKLVMKEQKEETIYDFGPKEKKRRKRINDADVLGKLMSFKQNKAYDDLKAHKLNFKSAPDDSEEQPQQQQQQQQE